MKQLVEANVHVLRQGERLLRRLDDATYQYGVALACSASVGTHLRHVLAHYSCLTEGIDSGRIDYEARHRDPVIETDRMAAVREIARVCHLLESDELLGVDFGLRVRSGACPGEGWSDTTVHRELDFLLSHTVHHYALVALLCGLQGVRVEPGFGVAPSTLRYWDVSALEAAH